MTKMELDRTVYNSLIRWWPDGVAFLNEHNIAPAGKTTWEARTKLKGFPMHRPDGPRGWRYIIPREVDEFLRSRCITPEPDQTGRDEAAS